MSKTVRTKEQINKDLKTEEFLLALGKLIACIIAGCFFAYLGYSFCLDNEYDVIKGLVFGALLPFWLLFLYNVTDLSFFKGLIAIGIWAFACQYIPAVLGLIMLFAILFYYVWNMVGTLLKDRTEEVERISNRERGIGLQLPQISKNIKTTHTPIGALDYTAHKENNNIIKDYEISEKEEYYCERCNEPISEEEYEENCGLCEDCDAEVHFGERYNGDDYDLYR